MYKFSLPNNRFFGYVKESKAELKKVIWPTKQETLQHTLIVIGISLGVAVVLGAMDYFFQRAAEILIK